MMVKISTEPIGSIPRPLAFIQAIASHDGLDPALEPLYDEVTNLAADRLGGSS
jgi:hypothetical protein